jgi:hypothetical protein
VLSERAIVFQQISERQTWISIESSNNLSYSILKRSKSVLDKLKVEIFDENIVPTRLT